MVRLIMGEKGTGKTKKLIEMINTTAQEDNGSVVCVEAKSTMTFDLHYHVRLISAYEYDLSNYEAPCAASCSACTRAIMIFPTSSSTTCSRSPAASATRRPTIS